MQPLDRGLNVAILHIAGRLFPCGFDVSENAPSTYEELSAHLDSGKRMVVYSGGSDQTIYGCPSVNWAFRAWHDWCHWRGRFPFTTEGEHAALCMQIEHLRELYGERPVWESILYAEIIGQAEYHRLHGYFPEDQQLFVRRYLEELVA